MLDTLLDIGNVLRNSEVGKIRYHRYFKPALLNDERKKTKVVYWSIPVDEDFEIQFDKKSEIIDQNLIGNRLFYLTFKASETSPENKYLFGDISYGTDKDGKEVGFYKMGNSEKKGLFGKSSFGRGDEDAKQFAGPLIEKFRASFESQKDEIENFLREQGQNQIVHLHFDFGGKHWYEFEDELKKINNALLGYFVEKQNDSLILRNFIYKTLIAGDSSSPDFDYKNTFKTKAFKDEDEVLDLIYSLDYSRKASVSERDIKVVILPRGEHLTADDIIKFFERDNKYSEQGERSKNLVAANVVPTSQTDEISEADQLFSPVVEDLPKNITQFDFVFSKRGDKKDEDLLEISGVDRHFLHYINRNINRVKKSALLEERRQLYPTGDKRFWGYEIKRSFLNILGDVTKDKKKYQSHLFKVLPQIYSGSYHRDDVLLPAFIEKVEYNTRNNEAGRIADYNLLKYDYYFLVSIRNNNGGKDMEEMKTSDSYKAGMLLGKMAQPLRREINSFEKNYVGLLSRRIADKQGLVKFMNFVNEKLIIHDVAYRNLRETSVELADVINRLDDKSYRKNYCSFGFFEGYFHFNKQTDQAQNTDNNAENQEEN
jgi:hypothetical protein